MHGAPRGRCSQLRRAGPHRAKGSHTGLRGAREARRCPTPVLGPRAGAQGSGLGTPPSDGAMGASPGRLGRHTCSRSSHGELCGQAPPPPDGPAVELPPVLEAAGTPPPVHAQPEAHHPGSPAGLHRRALLPTCTRKLLAQSPSHPEAPWKAGRGP